MQLDYETLESAIIEPVFNKKGSRIVAYNVVVKYGHDVYGLAPGCAEKPVFHETRNEKFTIRNIFGLGYKIAQAYQKKILTQSNTRTR